jgi:hypothetical protein
MKPIPTSAIARKGLGSVVAFVGYMLSPLSWWNDLVVNVPLALAFAWIVSFFYPSAFTGSFVLGYWLTNIVGMVMMHLGASAVVSKGPLRYDRKQIARDLIIALLYTAVIIALVKLNVLGPIPQLGGGK